MYSLSFTFTAIFLNLLFIQLTSSEQPGYGSPSILVPPINNLGPSTPPHIKQISPNPSSSIPKTFRQRKARRSGQSCRQRSETPNPLRLPSTMNDLNDNEQNLPVLPTFRTPFADSDERYCPSFQYAVCDSGVDKERILRVGLGKWRLRNCNRCE